MDSIEKATEEALLAFRNFGISFSDASREFEIFSATCKSIRDRYHPFIYWMYEIGLLHD